MAFTLKRTGTEFQDPPFAQFLFGNTQTAFLWLFLRLYMGYEWLQAGLHKIQDPGWTVTGESLKTFWVKAAAIPAAPAKPAITFDWYRSFLQFLIDTQSYVWFSKLIAFGEFTIGVAVMLGIFTGIAAFFGGFMNWNFMMAGSSSTNPLLFTIALGLVLGWKVAGYYGLDRYILPALGTPWQLGPLFSGSQKRVPAPATA